MRLAYMAANWQEGAAGRKLHGDVKFRFLRNWPPAHAGDGEAIKGHRGGQAASGAARSSQWRRAEGPCGEAAADHAGLYGALATSVIEFVLCEQAVSAKGSRLRTSYITPNELHPYSMPC